MLAEERLKMKVSLNKDAFAPERAHKTDAGLDIRTPYGFLIEGKGRYSVDTGIRIELPKNTVGLLLSKSGLNMHDGITTVGVIDEGYSGNICVTVQNHSFKNKEFKRGDKITQLIIVPCKYVDVETVDQISAGERGTKGFGSTGR